MVNLLEHMAIQTQLIMNYFLDEMNGLLMIDCFKMLVHAFATDGDAFIDHQMRFL
jgi:hypothetical protein